MSQTGLGFSRPKPVFPVQNGINWDKPVFPSFSRPKLGKTVQNCPKLECAASNGNRYPPYPQIVGHFFQALCMQYTNPSPWMVGRTDERRKWQQYPSASMLAKGKSSGNICISNSMPFLPSDLSANVQKPENVVNRLRLRLRLRQSLFNKNIYKYHIRFTWVS